MAAPKPVEPGDFLRFAETHEGRVELTDGVIVSMEQAGSTEGIEFETGENESVE